MKYFDWDAAPNARLRQERGVTFEEVLVAIEQGGLLDIVEHSNKRKYPNQQIFIVEILDYAYLIPFVEDEEKVLLKTIIPSRRATSKYIGE